MPQGAFIVVGAGALTTLALVCGGAIECNRNMSFPGAYACNVINISVFAAVARSHDGAVQAVCTVGKVGTVVLTPGTASLVTGAASTSALLSAHVTAAAAAASCAALRAAPVPAATPTKSASATPTQAVSPTRPPIVAVVVLHGMGARRLVLRYLPSIHELLSWLFLIETVIARAMGFHDASHEAAKAPRCMRLATATPTMLAQQGTGGAGRGVLKQREERE